MCAVRLLQCTLELHSESTSKGSVSLAQITVPIVADRPEARKRIKPIATTEIIFDKDSLVRLQVDGVCQPISQEVVLYLEDAFNTEMKSASHVPWPRKKYSWNSIRDMHHIQHGWSVEIIEDQQICIVRVSFEMLHTMSRIHDSERLVSKCRQMTGARFGFQICQDEVWEDIARNKGLIWGSPLKLIFWNGYIGNTPVPSCTKAL